MEFWASDLESLLAKGHLARLVWTYVERARPEAHLRRQLGGRGRSGMISASAGDTSEAQVERPVWKKIPTGR